MKGSEYYRKVGNLLAGLFIAICIAGLTAAVWYDYYRAVSPSVQDNQSRNI